MLTQQNRRDFLKTIGIGGACIAGVNSFMGTAWAMGNRNKTPLEGQKRPNILLCMSDDQSWSHAGAYGCEWVKTPAFDRVAEKGALFTHCFASVPSCSPSRASFLTGRHFWQNGAAAVHNSLFPEELVCYPDILDEEGYWVGGTGKLWSPGNLTAGGRSHNPGAPKIYKEHRLDPPADGMYKIDCAANFEDFLADKPEGKPFCFWLGSIDPHLPYEPGSGIKKGGKSIDQIDEVPGFMPDNEQSRSDLLDYAFEIEHFDQQVQRALDILEQKGELDNTLVIVTSDNGMPFLRAKTHCYEYSLHMPLAMMWPEAMSAGRVIDDFIGFRDFAPTFLEAAGLQPPDTMSGKSFLSVLTSSKQGTVDKHRDRIYAGKERHEVCRPNKLCYPIRLVRTQDYLYLWNIKPDRWPCGEPWSGYEYLGGIDYRQMAQEGDQQAMAAVERTVAKRPEEELYHVTKDPDCLNNLADDPDHADIKQQLRHDLEREMTATADPRIRGEGDFFDSCPAWHYYLGKNKKRTPPMDYRHDRFDPALNKNADKLNAEIERHLAGER